MIIAVFSDSHDNIWNLRKALEMAAAEQASMLIHCGDHCAPFVLAELAEFKGEVHCIFGNVDGDKYLMTEFAYTKFSNLHLHGDLGELEIEGRKLAFVHNPKMARALAATGEYQAVFFGHSHEHSVERIRECLLVNPGEIMGRINAPSFCLYDTHKDNITLIGLE
jgi:putative phosphoesterase